MARRIPQYPIDGDAIYVPQSDDAWNHERIDRERAEIEEQNEKTRTEARKAKAKYTPKTHPCDDYWRGLTRCRLDSVREYLDETADPERWYLQQPPAEVRRQTDSLVTKAALTDDVAEAGEAWGRGLLLLFRHGVSKVENSPFEITRDRKGVIDEKTVGRIDMIDPGLIPTLGHAVHYTYRPLTDGEKK